MPKLKSKAVVLSVIGHLVLVIALFQYGHSQTITRKAPLTISATLLQKGPAGLPKQMGAPSATPGSAAPAPAKKNTPPPLKTPVKETPKQPAPALPKNKPKTEKSQPAQKKTTPVESSSRNPFAKAGGGANVEQAENKTGGGSGGTSQFGSKTGAGGGGVRLDAPEFPFPHYLALLQFRIESQWRAPYAGQGEYLATVHFVIAKNGKVLSSVLEKSSGAFAFDQAALRAVQNASPLPALPEGSTLETLGVHFDFVANW